MYGLYGIASVFKRLLALTKVKILTQTSSELVQLDQQIATEHLFGKICLPV